MSSNNRRPRRTGGSGRDPGQQSETDTAARDTEEAAEAEDTGTTSSPTARDRIRSSLSRIDPRQVVKNAGGPSGGSSRGDSSATSSFREGVRQGAARARNALDPDTNARTGRSGNSGGSSSDGSSTPDNNPPSSGGGPQRTRPGSQDSTGAAPDSGTPERPDEDTRVNPEGLADRVDETEDPTTGGTQGGGGGGGGRPASDAVVGQVIAQNTELFDTGAGDPDGGPLTREDVVVNRLPDGSLDIQVSQEGQRAIARARGQDRGDRARLQGAADEFFGDSRRERELSFSNRREDINQNTQTPIEGAAQDFVDNSQREQDLAGGGGGQSPAGAQGFGRTNQPSDDLFGAPRPTNSGTANSGPIQPDLGGDTEVISGTEAQLNSIEQEIESQRGENVEVALEEDGTLAVTPDEQFGDNSLQVPGTKITFEELTGQLADGGREIAEDTANAAVNVGGQAFNPDNITRGPSGAVRITGDPFEGDLTRDPEGILPNLAAGTAQGALSLPVLALDTARTVDEAAELGVYAADETVNLGQLTGSGGDGSGEVIDTDRGGEILNDLSSAGTTSVGNAADSIADSPFRSLGTAVGSLAGTGAAFRATSNAGRLGTATRYAIQPGEELAGTLGFRATRATLGEGAANRAFPNGEPAIFSEELALRGGRRALQGGRSAARRIRDTDVSLTGGNRLGAGLGAFEVEISRSETESGDSDDLGELPDTISSTDPDIGDASRQSFRPEFDREADLDPTDPVQRRRRRNRGANDEALPDSVDTGRDEAFRNSLSRDRTQIDTETETDFFARPGPEAGLRAATGFGRPDAGVGALSDLSVGVGRQDLTVDPGGRVDTDPFADVLGAQGPRGVEFPGETELRAGTDVRTGTELGQEISTGFETDTRSQQRTAFEVATEQETENELEQELEFGPRSRAETFLDDGNQDDGVNFGFLSDASFSVRDSGIAGGEDILDDLTGL